MSELVNAIATAAIEEGKRQATEKIAGHASSISNVWGWAWAHPWPAIIILISMYIFGRFAWRYAIQPTIELGKLVLRTAILLAIGGVIVYGLWVIVTG